MGGLHGPGIKKMTCITTIFSAINTTWKQISVENHLVQIHLRLSSLFAIWIDRNLLPSGFDFEGSTAVKIMASSLSKPQHFFLYFLQSKLYYMEYSAADTSEVQWVSTTLLQFLTEVYVWNNTCLKKQRVTEWYAVKGVSNLLWLWRKRHEEILKHKSSIPESSIKQRMIKKIETMLE